MRNSVRDRLVAGIGTALVIGALGYALLFGLAGEMARHVEARMVLVTLRPPRAPRPTRQHAVKRRMRSASAAASPRNLKAKAAEIVAPPVVRAVPPPVIVAAKAGTGMAVAGGASTLPGPGEGAGGQGNGTGSGGAGTGEGGDEAPPRQIRGSLSFADLPPDLRAEGFGGTVGVRYNVGIDGRVGACAVTTSSGRATLDEATCRLIQQRFRFKPARDGSGHPVSVTVVENHTWVIDRTDDPGPAR